MSLLEITGLSKHFGRIPALEGLDLRVEAGEFLALLGGSGSGKSTLLRLVAGFETPDAGHILLDGRDLTAMPPYARPLNMMFQSYALFPHLSVRGNVAYGLKREGTPRAERDRRVAEALEMVGLGDFATRMPHRLSGGQRQRVALARALVKRPRLLLLDEPLGALDANLRERTGFELRALQRRTGASFIMVTHDQQEALALADRVAVLEQGRLVQLGAPREVYERPATRFVATFLGAANVLEGTLDGQGGLGCPGLAATLRPAAPLPAGTTALALRPERILAAPRVGAGAAAPNTTEGVVEEVAFRGDDSLLLVRAAGGALLRVSHAEEDGPPPPPGTPLRLHWEAAALVPLAG
ncbi:ABC transporter ATP-binding protein [Roseomonas marmotae]|uniref:ABC transporter ATP-binding protein n=1 Tax=Roseomonas marmotae TaxID=2768161 RepID=A0ABS3KET8_9PROT|nr:ABC transporter ATP-binding protein [Roseomonas marmotae]MBO1074871.1 ABC transporter ATP-binding protein [Roseomonas marmotae]QTI80626.1 ABC transporter ATP-binding protein [Roseomonas marmotae]